MVVSHDREPWRWADSVAYDAAMDRTEQLRRVGVVLLVAPMVIFALAADHLAPGNIRVSVVPAVLVSLVGLAVVVWAQMVMAAEIRMGIRRR